MSGLGLFIDGAHLSILWQQISSAQLDFVKLQHVISQHCGDRIVEAYCFDATSNGRVNEYFAAMQRCGIRVKLYEYACEEVLDANHVAVLDHDGVPLRRRVQKGVDVGLATHLLDSHRRRNWSKLALVASDADFAEPVQRLVEVYDVHLTLVGIPEKTSYALRPYATDFLNLGAVRSTIERKSRAATMP